MADSFTPTLNLTKPEINQSINTWGNKLNGDMDLIDQFATETDERLDTLEAFRVPVGGIIMWSGSLDAVPAGWALCNGSGGTPNLTDRFILGAHPGRPVGETGGSFTHAVATAAAGVHSHGGATAGHAITEAQMPFHAHGVNDPGHAHGWPFGNWRQFNGVNNDATFSPGPTASLTNDPVATALTGISIAGAGGNQAHAHGIPADGSHAHNVTVPNVPPYFALAFIMKLALTP